MFNVVLLMLKIVFVLFNKVFSNNPYTSRLCLFFTEQHKALCPVDGHGGDPVSPTGMYHPIHVLHLLHIFELTSVQMQKNLHVLGCVT